METRNHSKNGAIPKSHMSRKLNIKEMKNKNLLFVVLTMLSVISISSCKKDGNDPLPAIVIGQSYQGGIVFYVDASGQHGLVAATSDQVNGYWEDCTGYLCGSLITGANGTAVGTGRQNTIDIINGYGTGSFLAADICDKLVFAGYDDWFLPSKDELNLMYQYKDKIGGGNLAWDRYWSSSQVDEKNGYVQNFDNGQSTPGHKEDKQSIRAVRAF